MIRSLSSDSEPRNIGVRAWNAIGLTERSHREQSSRVLAPRPRLGSVGQMPLAKPTRF